MMEDILNLPNFLSFIGVGFIILLLFLWFLLPFAVFGTKVKLNDLINETKKTNDRLTSNTIHPEQNNGLNNLGLLIMILD